MSVPYETPNTQVNILEAENRTYLDLLKKRACEVVDHKTIEQIAYSLEIVAAANVPSYTNAGANIMHDFKTYITDDITAYRSSLLLKFLKDLDSEHLVITAIDIPGLDFKQGDTFAFSNLPDALYNQIQSAIRQTPVFTELQRLADIFKTANDTGVEIILSKMNAHERYILLRILGMNAAEIEDLLETKTAVTLPHYPGLSVTLGSAEKVVLEYNPGLAAEIAAHKTLLWSKTGEQITLGLGKKHLSPTFENSLSEGYIPTDTYNKFETRYGNGYADITRRLSSCIGRDIETVKTILWNDPDHKISTSDTQQWLALSEQSPSIPVREFFRLLHDVCCDQNSEQDNEMNSIPHYAAKKIISYRDGSCKDAESYYCTADSEKLIQQRPEFLEKCGYGVNIALVLSPIYVQSTLLNPGHLVKLVKDEVGNITGVQPLRCTMFMFEESEAKDAFGTQYENTRDRLDRAHITPLSNLQKR